MKDFESAHGSKVESCAALGNAEDPQVTNRPAPGRIIGRLMARVVPPSRTQFGLEQKNVGARGRRIGLYGAELRRARAQLKTLQPFGYRERITYRYFTLYSFKRHQVQPERVNDTDM